MRPVSAPAVDTGGTSSASVELPTPLNALTGSAGPLGMGRRRRSTGGRRGQRRWGADAGTDVDELDHLAAPSMGMRTACSRPRTSTSQPCCTTCAATGTCCERSPPRRTLSSVRRQGVHCRGGQGPEAGRRRRGAGRHRRHRRPSRARASWSPPPAGPAVPDASRRGSRRRSNPHLPVIFGGPD